MTNIEKYEYDFLDQVREKYYKQLKKSKGVDPDFYGYTLKFK